MHNILASVLWCSRVWHRREQQKYDLHPSVVKALSAQRPKNWHLVVLQWPHVSTTDEMRLAYTQSEEKAIRDLQTTTSIGKYLKQHWPNTPDHIIRSWADSYCPDKCDIQTTTLQIVQAAEFGPMSCMNSTSSHSRHPFTPDLRDDLAKGCEDHLELHPYSVYTPDYGWGVAVRMQGTNIVGRALVNNKAFVRSYMKVDVSPSPSDHKLEAWLEGQGYRQVNGWPTNTRLACIDHPDEGFLAPYLDGENNRVSAEGNYLYIDPHGEYKCENTDGTADREDEDTSIGTCSCCGETIHEDDDYFYAGRSEEEMVGSCCVSDYTYVRGRPYSHSRGEYGEYYVPNNQAERPYNCSYQIDTEDPPNNVVQLEDGDWAELDDAVCIDGDYYLYDDYNVVSLDEDHGDDSHALIQDTWQDGDGNRYHDDVDSWEDHNGDKWKTDVESEVVDGELWLASEIASVRNSAQIAPLFAELS